MLHPEAPPAELAVILEHARAQPVGLVLQLGAELAHAARVAQVLARLAVARPHALHRHLAPAVEALAGGRLGVGAGVDEHVALREDHDGGELVRVRVRVRVRIRVSVRVSIRVRVRVRVRHTFKKMQGYTVMRSMMDGWVDGWMDG